MKTSPRVAPFSPLTNATPPVFFFLLLLLIAAAATPGAHARRGGSLSSFTRPTPTPTPTPWQFSGCKGDPQPYKDGPWDAVDYSNVVTGADAYANLYCGALDICFAIDESGSMKAENFRTEINFVRKLTSRIVARTHPNYPSNFSAWSFDGGSNAFDHKISSLTSDYHQLIDNLNVAGYDGGCTNIAAGLSNCAAELAASPPSRKKAIILLSDGAQSVDANNNGVYNVQEEDAHVQFLVENLRNSGIAILTVELYQNILGQSEELSAFLKNLASKRVDNTPRFFDSSFSDLIATNVLVDLLSGVDGVCDPDIVGLPPADVWDTQVAAATSTTKPRHGASHDGDGWDGEFCSCAESDDFASEKYVVVETTGVDSGLCTLQMTTVPRRFVCDLDATDYECRLQKGKAWARTLDSAGNPLPPGDNGQVECHLVDSTITILVVDV